MGINYTTLLARADVAGVYHLPAGGLEDVIRAAEANDQAVFRVELRDIRNKDGALTNIAKAMQFPDWFGGNFDALADCLGDLSWHRAAGYVLILEHCDGIHGDAEDDFVSLVDIFSRAAGEWREEGVPFWCFVDMLADGIAWIPTVS